jgi:hypothetical protein
MRRSTEWARASALLLSLVLLASLGGCRQAVRAGLGLVGVEPQEQDPFGETGRARATATPRGGVVTSTYQHAPTLVWSTLALGQPSSVARSIFEGMSPSYGCQAVPQGLTRVAQIPFGSPSRPLQELGPIEVGVAGNLRPWGSLFTFDRDALAQSAMASSALLGGRGTGACGYTTFMYVRLNILGGGAAEPVSVLR